VDPVRLTRELADAAELTVMSLIDAKLNELWPGSIRQTVPSDYAPYGYAMRVWSNGMVFNDLTLVGDSWIHVIGFRHPRLVGDAPAKRHKRRLPSRPDAPASVVAVDFINAIRATWVDAQAIKQVMIDEAGNPAAVPESAQQDTASTTLEQFRACLANSSARARIGINLTDVEAISILGSERSTREAYAAWQLGETLSRPPTYVPASAPMATPIAAATYASARQAAPAVAPVLPFRFNAPPGWPQPPASWMAQWAGLDVPPAQTPTGVAPAPPGWRFWSTVEPAWSQWQAALRARHLRSMWINVAVLAAGLILSIIGLALILTPAGGTALIFWGAVLWGLIGAVRSGSRATRVAADPWSVLREQLTK